MKTNFDRPRTLFTSRHGVYSVVTKSEASQPDRLPGPRKLDTLTVTNNLTVGELARALPSFYRTLSVDVMVGMCDSIERYPVQPC